MKRADLLKRLQTYGCSLKREHDHHTLWQNPKTGQVQVLPGYTLFPPGLARKFCLGLSVPPM